MGGRGANPSTPWVGEGAKCQGKGSLSLDQLAYTIPLRIHEDAGPCTKRKSSNVINWSSLLSRGNDKTTRMPIGSYIKLKQTKVATTDGAWAEILQSFELLASQATSSAPIAKTDDGHRFGAVLMFACGDCGARSREWGLVDYNEAEELCSECLANRSSMPFNK